MSVGLQNKSSPEAIRGYRMLNQVEKEFPDDPDVLTTLGGVLLRGKQPVEALRRFERVLVLRPAYAPYEVSAASALIAAGRKSDAIRHLERALQLDPLLQQAVELLSRLYGDEGESAKAAGIVAQYRREMGFAAAR